MQKYHIIEFQAYNDGRCAIPIPLKGYEVNTKGAGRCYGF